MKKFVLLILVCACTGRLFSQVLFTYGPYSVDKQEFLSAYNKNKTAVANKEEALKEYLDLYSKFKLKVKTARLLRLDTLAQLKYDLQNFRSQVAEGYMNDEKGLNALVEEVLERSKKDIHLLHFYVNLPPQMPAADTLKAYSAVNDLSARLTASNTLAYAPLVDEISKKYITVQGDDMGFITALVLPYEIENRVYTLKPGDVTQPYRTKSALHIFKNAGERKSVGKWKIAQILLSVPPNASVTESAAIAARADSIYKLLIAGADFSSLAKQFSEDKLTFMNGGEMPEFGSGKFELPFEAKVFALKKDGEIAKPIFTGFGYHIVKRLQHRDIPSDKSDEAFIMDLKQQIQKDARINGAKSDFLKTVKQKTGYKKNAAVKDAELFRYADSVVITNEVRNYPINNKIIFAFAKSNVKGADWLNFVKDYKLNADVYKGESNKELLNKYISTASFEYYRNHLEEYDKDFNHQMQEFKEGNMLFEIMERKVWGKAATDSSGLQKYYDEHKSAYKWAESADILLFNCGDKKVAEDAVTALRTGINWRQLVTESEESLQADSGRYELSQLQLPAGVEIKEGLVIPPYQNSTDNTIGFMKVLRMFPANQQRSFTEAKGLVINDYQNYLEGLWVAELKKKYPIKINEAVFKSLLKE